MVILVALRIICCRVRLTLDAIMENPPVTSRIRSAKLPIVADELAGLGSGAVFESNVVMGIVHTKSSTSRIGRHFNAIHQAC